MRDLSDDAELRRLADAVRDELDEVLLGLVPGGFEEPELEQYETRLHSLQDAVLAAEPDGGRTTHPWGQPLSGSDRGCAAPAPGGSGAPAPATTGPVAGPGSPTRPRPSRPR